MILIVGLGNPGRKYELSRHNLGFQVLDEFREKDNLPNFRLSRKFNALISENYLDSKKIILVKPQTFMNLSGKAVRLLTKIYHLKSNNLIVIHDDIDLPLGKIRIIKNRGAGGHKGVESVIKELKTKSFIRFRVGIQPKSGKSKNVEKPSTGAKPRTRAEPSTRVELGAGQSRSELRSTSGLGAELVPHRNRVSGAGFVLQKFSKAEEKVIKVAIKKTCLAIKMILKEGLEKTMAQYN